MISLVVGSIGTDAPRLERRRDGEGKSAGESKGHKTSLCED